MGSRPPHLTLVQPIEPRRHHWTHNPLAVRAVAYAASIFELHPGEVVMWEIGQYWGPSQFLNRSAPCAMLSCKKMHKSGGKIHTCNIYLQNKNDFFSSLNKKLELLRFCKFYQKF